jgi:hypothetical protein
MPSSKFEKYMKKYQEKNYASKVRKIEKSDLGKYCDRSSIRKTSEASSSDFIQQSRKIEEEVIELSGNSGQLERSTQPYGKYMLLTEEPIIYIGEEDEEARIQCETGRIIRSKISREEDEPVISKSKKRVRRNGKSSGEKEVQ